MAGCAIAVPKELFRRWIRACRRIRGFEDAEGNFHIFLILEERALAYGIVDSEPRWLSRPTYISMHMHLVFTNR